MPKFWETHLSMDTCEFVVFFLVISSLFLGVAYIKIVNGFYYGDTAAYYEMNGNILHRGFPYTTLPAEAYFYTIDRQIATQNASVVCGMNLEPPRGLEINFLSYHMQLISYVFALFSLLIPIHIVWQGLTAAAFIGFIALCYLILRKNGISIVNSCLFCLLVIVHPAWNQALLGQIYPDRFFMLTSLVFIYFFTRKPGNYPILILAGLVNLIITERTGLVLGIFMLGYVALYWKEIGDRREKVWRSCLGIAFIAYSAIVTKLFITNNIYLSTYLPANIDILMRNLSNPTFFQMTLLFLLFNVVILGVLAAFEWRAFLISLPILSLNIIGNVGGAEKTGWITHYHSYYFPILVWAAMLGYIHLSKVCKERGRKEAVTILILALVMFTAVLNPYSYNKLDISLDNVRTNGLLTTIVAIPGTLNGDIQPLLKYSDEMKRIIPQGSTVTSPEGYWPILYENRTLHLFPAGVDSADYAVLVIKGRNESGYILGGMVSFLGQETADEADRCLMERMKRDGYDFRNATINEAARTAIVKRIQSP